MRHWSRWIFVTVLTLTAAGCRGNDPNAVIHENSRVYLEYSLFAGSRPLIEASRPEKAEFVMGSGIFPRKLEAALIGLKRNDKLTVELTPAEAFGEHRQDYLARVPIAILPKGIEVKEGTWLKARDPQSHELASFRIIKVLEDSVVMDRNHPLAGMSLEYRIRIIRAD